MTRSSTLLYTLQFACTQGRSTRARLCSNRRLLVRQLIRFPSSFGVPSVQQHYPAQREFIEQPTCAPIEDQV